MWDAIKLVLRNQYLIRRRSDPDWQLYIKPERFMPKNVFSFDNPFFASGVGFPLYLEIFYIITQGSCIASGSLWGDARFEPGTSAPEVWCPTNDPPHHRDVAKKCFPLSLLFWPFNCHQLVSLCLSVNDDIVSPHLSCGLTKPGKLSTTFCKAMRRLE